MTALTLNLNSIIKLTREQFYQLCEENPDLQLERNAQGEAIVMPPKGGETARSNVNLILQLAFWNEQNQLDEVFDSSTGFTLPNGDDRSPDVSWIEKSRWDNLTKEQREKFIAFTGLMKYTQSNKTVHLRKGKNESIFARFTPKNT